jgi:hypothetical protein
MYKFQKKSWPFSMVCGYWNVGKCVLPVYMLTLLLSMMRDQVTRGLLWKSEVSYTSPELVVAVVLALVGLVVVVVLVLCLFVYKYSV